MDKIFSLLKRRIDLPSLTEIRFVVRSLPQREGLIFLILAAVFSVSVFGAFLIINDRMAVEVPIPGGELREGIVGTPRFINPLIATSDADRDLVRLIFAGLLKSDGRERLVPKLAEKYEISDDGLMYTFTLKEDAHWHDGERVTSDDVAFTIKLAQTPLVRSPKRANWEGVETQVIDERTIQFILKKPYAPFLENATLGILPKHLWDGIKPEQVYLSQLNVEPIGSGPYRLDKIARNSSGIVTSYTLEAFDDHAPTTPYIRKIVLNFYNSEKEFIDAYTKQAVDSIGSISPKNLSEAQQRSGTLKTFNLSRIFGVFFNQSHNKSLTDHNVRKALALAIDKDKIIREVLAGYGTPVSYPIPPGTLGAMDDQNPPSAAYNPEEAKKLLEKSGWKPNKDTGILEKKMAKENVALAITLSTSSAADLAEAANLIKAMWEQIGVQVKINIFEIGDFEKDVIRTRDYDALLFGEVVGYDPDPFAFWHSSQRNDPGLNIALYASIAVDKTLNEARSISDPDMRAEKYESFQREILKDMPAVFLYSPYYLYIIPSYLKGVEITQITTPAERFSDVENWYVETKKVWKFLVD